MSPTETPVTATEAPVVAGHPDRWRILAVLCSALCVVVLDNTILSVAVPRVGEALRAGESALQWIVAGYSLVLAALLLPLAGLGDRFGRKGLLLIGTVVFGLASAVAALATTSGQLIAARGLMGMGGAAMMPATLAVLSNVFPAHERGRAIAIWSGVSSLAAAAGPVLSGGLLAHFWWGSVFLVNVPVTAGLFVAVLRLVPDSRDPAAPPIDRIGSLIWAGSLGLMLFGLIEGTEKGWTSGAVIGSVLAGASLFGAFGWWERRTPHPLLAPAALADRRMQAGIVAVPVIFFTIFGLQFVLTQWFQGVRDLTPLAAGLCFVPHAAAVLVGSLASTRLVARVGLAKTIMGGLLVLAGSVSVGAVAHTEVVAVILAISVAGFGAGLALPCAVELIMGSVPPEQAGQAAGINESVVEAGGAFGIAVMGSVLAAAAGGAGTIAPGRLVGPGAATAQDRFTDALAAPLLTAAGLLVVAAVVVLRRTRGTDAGRPGDAVGQMVGVSAAGVVAPGPADAGGDVTRTDGGAGEGS